MDSSPPGSSVHGILQARILECVAMPFSRGSSQPRDWTCVSCLAGEFFTTEPPGKPFASLNAVKCPLSVLPGTCQYLGVCPLIAGLLSLALRLVSTCVLWLGLWTCVLLTELNLQNHTQLWLSVQTSEKVLPFILPGALNPRPLEVKVPSPGVSGQPRWLTFIP